MLISFGFSACWKRGVQYLLGKEVDSCGIIYRSTRTSAAGRLICNCIVVLSRLFRNEARVEYHAVTHRSRVVEQPNKKECAHPLVLLDVTLGMMDMRS